MRVVTCNAYPERMTLNNALCIMSAGGVLHYTMLDQYITHRALNPCGVLYRVMLYIYLYNVWNNTILKHVPAMRRIKLVDTYVV